MPQAPFAGAERTFRYATQIARLRQVVDVHGHEQLARAAADARLEE
jgi:hypothetical protein